MAYDELERLRAANQRHRENSARLAKAYAKYESTGQGSFEFAKRVNFGLTFIEEPFMAYGCYVDVDDLCELLGVDEHTTPPLPLCTGMVTNWDQDERDFYVGAWVAVSVYFPPGMHATEVPIDAQPVIEHHFSFEAIAIKDVPLDLKDD